MHVRFSFETMFATAFPCFLFFRYCINSRHTNYEHENEVKSLLDFAKINMFLIVLEGCIVLVLIV
ncbi:hypothetical protein CR513_55024, partial [Mucuna pruriens]